MSYLWYPAAFLMGVAIQAFYLPSMSANPTEGVIKILLMALGTCAMYVWGYR